MKKAWETTYISSFSEGLWGVTGKPWHTISPYNSFLAFPLPTLVPKRKKERSYKKTDHPDFCQESKKANSERTSPSQWSCDTSSGPWAHWHAGLALGSLGNIIYISTQPLDLPIDALMLLLYILPSCPVPTSFCWYQAKNHIFAG